MWNYSQPNFYSFSEDSLFLVNKAIESNLSDQEDGLTLDLGAGCGVLGLEYLSKSLSNKLIFVERQKEFIYYLSQNINQFHLKNPKADIQYFCCSVKSFQKETSKNANLILMNPPYFDKGKSRLGPNINRNICRHFIDEDLSDWISCATHHLKEGGSLFILSRERNLSFNNQWQEVACWEISGTFLFHLFLNKK
jgi:tRNA1(Val) A37 N6-methylase TrmN6